MRSREVLMCSDRYADDMRFLLPKTQLPPTRSLFSKQSNGMPASFSFFAAAMPDEPAPMTQAVGGSRPKRAIAPGQTESDTGVKFGARAVSVRAAARRSGRVRRSRWAAVPVSGGDAFALRCR